VEVRKGLAKAATRVVFAPAQNNIRLQGSAEALKRSFAARPLTSGDTIATAGHQRVNADMPDHVRQLLNARLRAAGDRLSVVSTTRAGSSTSTAARWSSCSRIYRAAWRAPRRRHLRRPWRHASTIDALREMVELPLRHPELFQRLGVDPPKGVLLTARPAPARPAWRAPSPTKRRAILPHRRARDHGLGLWRVGEEARELFEEAGQAAPSIIFIDEIDSIAPKRDKVRARRRSAWSRSC
jgi:transitional endoplasmic reticulum ATPase